MTDGWGKPPVEGDGLQGMSSLTFMRSGASRSLRAAWRRHRTKPAVAVTAGGGAREELVCMAVRMMH